MVNPLYTMSATDNQQHALKNRVTPMPGAAQVQKHLE